MMKEQPAWTWRLRAHSAEHRLARWGYRFLWWSTDSRVFANHLISVVGLLFGVIVVMQAVFFRGTIVTPAAVMIVAAAAVVLALKGIVAHGTGLVFHEKRFVGGAPTEDQFQRLVSQRARKVALVGQNLGSRFDEKYDLTLQSIRALLSREDSNNTCSLEEFWIVLQTPLALFSVDPLAARHLSSTTVEGLKRLASDLGNDAARVNVAFHPAATLSMLIVDWHLERRVAVVTPKVQTLPIIHHRLNVDASLRKQQVV